MRRDDASRECERDAREAEERTPRCRYCGHDVRAELRYEGHNHVGPATYDCRDADACGDRIRENNRRLGIPEDTGDLPF